MKLRLVFFDSHCSHVFLFWFKAVWIYSLIFNAIVYLFIYFSVVSMLARLEYFCFSIRSLSYNMNKSCTVQHISTQDGVIGVKFWLRVEQTPGRERGSLGVMAHGGPWGGGFNIFLGWGYSLSWIGQLPFVFAWASPNVVRYLGERLAHVLMQNYSNWPRGFYTVAQKIRKFILFFHNFWSLLPYI